MAEQNKLVPVYSQKVEAGLGLLRGMEREIRQLVPDENELKRMMNGLKEVCRLADRNPKIARSFVEAPDTWQDCINRTVQSKLNPLPNAREVWFIPRNNGSAKRMELTWQLGYMAYIKFIERMGGYHHPVIELVYDNCQFSSNPASREPIQHSPWFNHADAPGEVRLGYLIMYPKDGGPPFHKVVTRAQINKAKEKAPDDTIWRYNFDEMASKVVLARAARFMPLRSEDKELAMQDYVALTGEKGEETDPTEPPKQGLQRTTKPANEPPVDPNEELEEDFKRKLDEEGQA